MSEDQAINPVDLICNLKAVVAGLECQHKMQQEAQKQAHKCEKPPPPPMFIMVPIEQEKCDAENGAKGNGRCSGNGNGHHSPCGNDGAGHGGNGLALHQVKSRELRGGILYTGCGCLHRDGLQDSCPRSACQGQPECMTKPWPVCPPGLLFRARHPEIYPAPPNPNAMTF